MLYRYHVCVFLIHKNNMVRILDKSETRDKTENIASFHSVLFSHLPVVMKQLLHQSSPFCCKFLPEAPGNVHLPSEKIIH